jgi:endonuclease/exonuclease/phosphatase family metal-dependent hydrolase
MAVDSAIANSRVTEDGAAGAPVAEGTASSAISLRICTFNTYLIPAMAVNDANKSCSKQSERAAGIGHWIRQHNVDIALLQEVWGGGQPMLEAAVTGPISTQPGQAGEAGAPAVAVHSRVLSPVSMETFPRGVVAEAQDGAANAEHVVVTDRDAEKPYVVIPWCKSWGTAVLDSVWQIATARGGLWVAGRHATLGSQVPRAKWHTYSKSMTRSRKGAVAARYCVKGADGQTVNLIVVNTHLDPINTKGVMEHQFEELMAFLEKNVLGASAFGEHEFAATALLLAGDFNADPRDSLGNTMLAMAQARGTKMRDLYGDWCARFSDASVPTYDIATNNLVLWDHVGRFDWLMAVDVLAGIRLRNIGVYSASVHRPKLADGMPLSDHWPVVVDITL